jgi:Icc-related predicted phosphoesterase
MQVAQFSGAFECRSVFAGGLGCLREPTDKRSATMKALLISDLHYALKQFDWVAETAEKFDLVIIAGDQVDIAGQLDGRVQVVVILKYLQRMAKQTRVIVASGNHDLDRRNHDGERVASWMSRVRALGIPTDFDSFMCDGALVTICPWWDGPIAKARLAQILEADAAKPKQRWFWVYHAPPEGSPTSWTGKRHYGDAALSDWISLYAPDIVFSGHIHEAPFKTGGAWCDRIGNTWVFNSGRQIGPIPAHVIVDTDAGAAAWFSLAGAESVALDRASSRQALAGAPEWLNTPVRDQNLA